jgi:SAM-dependent methyltransferase
VDLDLLQSNWDELGKGDPMWAILSQPDKRNRRWNAKEFFATGQREIEGAISYVNSLGILLQKRRALDFGCGIGRLTQALCQHFDRVDGVDIAQSMIQLAKKFNQFNDRCFYQINASSDLRLFDDESFDFVYSVLVLQHMRPEYSETYIREFTRVLARGGALVFQIPSEPTSPAFLSENSDQTQCDSLPEAAFRATIIPADLQLSIEPASQLDISVTVVNTSAFEWPAPSVQSGICPIKLGNHWLDRHGHLLQNDDGRSDIREALRPSEAVSLVLTINSPRSSGLYNLELDLVQEHIAWFKDHGSESVTIPVEVIPNGEVNEPFGNVPLNTDISTDDEVRVVIPKMEMHGVNRQRVLRLIESSGGSVVDVHEDLSAGSDWQSFTYCVTKL